MCGVLGILAKHPLQMSGHDLQSAVHALRHRGPDDEGYLLFDAQGSQVRAFAGPDTMRGIELPPVAGADASRYSCAFGHRRLSIIDLSAAGHQPMASADGRCWVTYNGEIYNYLELRRELEALGAAFRTASDTEVLLEAYRHWGTGMLTRLIGMFAFAILDLEARRVLLARDQFGIKPLYLSRRPEGLAFASEIKALLRLTGVGRRGNAERAYQYLRYGERDAAPPTLFQDVERLPAAHFLHVDLDTLRTAGPTRYWAVDLERRSDATFAEAAAEVRRLFDASVRLHLRSDVPVGSCLSGGLDSTAIVLEASRALAGQAPMHTFSFIADDPEIAEERYVDLVGGTVVHKVRPQAADIAADIGRLIEAQELPFESLSIYAQYRVFSLASQAGIKVMLDGQGSDEIFGGYYTLLGARISGLLADLRLATARRVLAAAPSNARSYRARMLATAAGRLLPASIQGAVARGFGEPEFPDWLAAGWFRERRVQPRLRDHGRGSDALRQELKLCVEHLTLPALLRYEDGNSMHFSIESRVPFCTPDLAQFALSLPAHYLIADDGDTKSVFRAAVSDLVPAAILRREKVGFAVPERAWLRSLHQWVAGAPYAALPFLDPHAVRREIAAALASDGRWPPHVWRLVNMAFWSQAFKVEWD
jgi:asparagine synthase (glutamine-hydrolysing)